MTKRLSRLLAILGATTAFAVGGAGVAQASNGADDPPGQHQEHAPGIVDDNPGADDAPGADDNPGQGHRDRHRGHHRHNGHHRHGHHRHGGRHGGHDGGPNHQ